MVCPHDTAKKPERWFRFVQYVNHRLAIAIHLEISLDFKDFRQQLETADIVYANPADSIYLLEQKEFSPLVRPLNLYDEIVFIAKRDISNPTLDSLQGADIATVTSMLPTKVALHMLKERGIAPAQILDKASWLGVINSVSKNEAPFGIVYKDTYDELSPNAKEMVNVFAASDEKVIFHQINIGVNVIPFKSELESILLAMNTDETGKNVLQELNIDGWQLTTPEEIGKIKHIITAY